MVLSVGVRAPEFELRDERGNLVSLASLRGKRVVLYFYPKDDTPGCTVEAQGFQRVLEVVSRKNAVVLGVSPDDLESHRNFKAKYGLSFPLLSDPDHQVASRYEAWGPKKFLGREFEGILRTTYVIGPTGVIEEAFENVEPEGHCDIVLGKL